MKVHRQSVTLTLYRCAFRSSEATVRLNYKLRQGTREMDQRRYVACSVAAAFSPTHSTNPGCKVPYFSNRKPPPAATVRTSQYYPLAVSALESLDTARTLYPAVSSPYANRTPRAAAAAAAAYAYLEHFRRDWTLVRFKTKRVAKTEAFQRLEDRYMSILYIRLLRIVLILSRIMLYSVGGV